MNLTLQRTQRTSACTQGVLRLPNGLNLQTLELPWVPEDGFPGGHPDVSCVPAGVYQLRLHNSPMHPLSFALSNPDLGVIAEPDPAHPNYRADCLIHVANYVNELEGCIGVGMSAGQCVLSNSVQAFENFNDQVPWIEGHTLTILDP